MWIVTILYCLWNNYGVGESQHILENKQNHPRLIAYNGGTDVGERLRMCEMEEINSGRYAYTPVCLYGFSEVPDMLQI